MALTLTVDGITGIDESLGLQQQDILAFPNLVAGVFNTALGAYKAGLSLSTAIQFAGDPTDGTGGNDVQVSGDMVTGLSLTDANGNLFNGTQDSGLLTLDGHQINLKSATNDNVVLGIDSVTGAVVFAIYLEEVTSSGNIVGGDFWVALFQPLKHPDPDNPNDVVDLTNKLFVSAEQVINFSFAGAPSGQNQFMAFKSGNVTIVATGEKNGDTVNSGQGANLPNSTDKTALGTNSQSIKAGGQLNFNFTTGFNADFIVPDLTPTEASSQANIQFGDVFQTTGAAFNMVKVTGGGASTKPKVLLAAWNTENLASTKLETGTDFISGHSDDVMVAITKVFVNGVDVTNNAAMVTNNNDGTFTVIGATENARIKVQTTDSFNRLSIKNAGTDQVVFSVQAFSLESTSSARAEAGSKIDFYDDGPGESGTDVVLNVWEDALTGGNPDNDGEPESVVATGNLTTLLVVGRDTPGLHFGAIAALNGTTLKSDGDLVTFTIAVTKGANVLKSGVTYDDQIMLTIGGQNYVQILVKADGAVRLELLKAVNHSGVTIDNPDEDLLGINLGSLFEAFDEDGDRQTFGASAVRGQIEDDAPVFDISLGAGVLETDDGAMAGGNSGGDATDTKGAGTLFNVVTSKPGADGDGGTVWKLELSAATVATTLKDTATGQLVQLTLTAGGVVEGRTVTSGDLVFSLSVNTTNGSVTLTQARAVMHGTAQTSSFPSDTVGLGLGPNDFINLRGTLSDGEPTPDKATDAVNIAPNIRFTDDGPLFDITDLDGTLKTDDADLTGGSTDNGTGKDTASIGLGTLFSVAVNKPGADGGGNPVYTLELGANATSLTLKDTATGELVKLVLNGAKVEGRTVTTNALVFDLTVNSGTGEVTQTQYRAVVHSSASTSSPYNGDTTGLGIANAVILKGTLSDGEGANADKATDTIDISDSVRFSDDGPAIAVYDSGLPATYATGAQGDWSDKAGADGFASLGVKLVSYQIDANGTVTVNTALGDGGDSNPYTFAGSVTADFNKDGTTETVNFTLVFDPDADTYNLQVATPPSTVTTFSTANGSLDAGGPDPVRTLTVGTKDIVFSAVNPTTNTDLIKANLDKSEAFIEANATYLSADALNVSTSGIANGNNVLEGNAIGGVPDNLTTQGGKKDESFVVDPKGLVSSMKVFIDNSVGGYDTATEQLYFRTYNANGSVSAWTLVTAAMLSSAPGGQKTFTVGNPNGPNTIDAVQLGMGIGTIKIPVIAFTQSQTFDPDSLTLNFLATETDRDGDSANDGFTVHLDPVIA